MNIDYEINKDTLVLISEGENKTYVLEKENEYMIPCETLEVIEHSCEYFGSTYEGRHLGTTKLLGITHKTPIIIEESNNLIFFPTSSPKSKNCIWVSLNHILNYKQGKKEKTTEIEFKNGKKIEINASIGSINNQVLRASRLDLLIRERKK